MKNICDFTKKRLENKHKNVHKTPENMNENENKNKKLLENKHENVHKTQENTYENENEYLDVKVDERRRRTTFWQLLENMQKHKENMYEYT